jgi:hypothetical protein
MKVAALLAKHQHRGVGHISSLENHCFSAASLRRTTYWNKARPNELTHHRGAEDEFHECRGRF